MSLPNLSPILPSNLSLPRAAAYMRAATRAEVGGFSATEEQIRRLAQQDGYELVAFYKDVRRSRGGMEKRPGLREMFSALQAGHFSILYIQDLSRLSRDSQEAWRLLQVLKQAGLGGIQFLHQPSLHPGLFLQILLSFNEACTLYSQPGSEWSDPNMPNSFPLPEAWRK